MGKGNKGKKNEEGCELGALSGLPQRDPWKHALAGVYPFPFPFPFPNFFRVNLGLVWITLQDSCE